ncbi:MAG: undecaprenyl-diphosphatase UppP [Fimbriimonadia bacterium]|nr:undecaprenyl-diphosphatase UppP [Fimbriimonadia bacterium]
MNLLEAIVLGAVQGATEFLPISSSGHLILARYWFGWEMPEERALIFDLALHGGTLLAILLYFGRDLLRFFSALMSADPQRATDKRLAWGILLGCIPAGLAGLLFDDPIENFFRNQFALIAVLLIAVGLLMGAADRFGKKARALTEVRLTDAAAIGIAQAFALIPGFSRSGITMTAGLMMGLEREAAARFSFLLSAPITIAAVAYGGKKALGAGIPSDFVVPMLAGAVTSAVVGLACVAFLIKFLKTKSLAPFVIYRIVIGVATLLHLWLAGR